VRMPFRPDLFPALSVPQTLLIDGYISQTFGSRAAEQYFLNLLKSTSIPPDATLSYTEREEYFFIVHSVPPHIPASSLSPNLPGRWLLDRGIMDRGTVVPQTMWSPRSAIDIRQHVERRSCRCPSFSKTRTGDSPVFPLGSSLMANAMIFETPMTPPRWVKRRRHISVLS
jgi:hypothetical protein